VGGKKKPLMGASLYVVKNDKNFLSSREYYTIKNNNVCDKKEGKEWIR